MALDARDIEIRNATYRRFVELGRGPTASEVANATNATEAEVHARWETLHDAHALVLDAAGALRMCNPFSAVETGFRVDAAGRSWFANCGWDAFGIGAALHVDSDFDTHCADCDEPLHILVRDGRPDDASLVFLVPMPATQWWNDIGFT